MTAPGPFTAAFDTSAAVMSEEALAEREYIRTGQGEGFDSVAVDVDGEANGANGTNGTSAASSKKVASCSQELEIHQRPGWS